MENLFFILSAKGKKKQRKVMIADVETASKPIETAQ